ncbi:MAG: helix-turn-helix transcriptional regulator [Flavobacteriales bacterium]|jgi:DNA-binding HxlR family transcriptional regulator|nr:helix-turn-helix transcriptional regulator [Flavobacteriales bacterium]MBK6755782.1 helix-turn-helix transcriptional regulator [Flavobacteriales bacterium]MBK7084484.1 helix-turn-helix transcriptional regulator [Flavobacteriales bacterium]MBK7751450.1 helix-turn-helix transcriptional regulator [Flavobacteriales bacterium]MBK9073792.1 helix-turn-helix transcriptional regulator [Flavobacteriales bacterium]
MPDFTHDGHVYYNPLEFAMAHIGGTWKSPILYRLKKEKQRFSELKKSMPHISDRQLAATLRDLEKNRLVSRKVYPEVPPRTEYALTKRGETAIPVIETLRQFGLEMMKDNGIKSEFYFPRKKGRK